MGLFDRGVQMLLTTVGAFAAFSLMTIAVGTDYWLYSRGVCKVKSNNENETSKKNEEVMTHSGLWRTCCLEGNFKGLCKQIDHFPEDTDYTADAAEYFLRAVRASSIFPILSVIMLFMAGLCIAASEFYKSRHNIILSAGIFFVSAGLSNIIGIIVYISANAGDPSKSDSKKNSYSYGWSFYFGALSFIMAEMVGVLAVHMFIDRHREVRAAEARSQGAAARGRRPGPGGGSGGGADYLQGSAITRIPSYRYRYRRRSSSRSTDPSHSRDNSPVGLKGFGALPSTEINMYTMSRGGGGGGGGGNGGGGGGDTLKTSHGTPTTTYNSERDHNFLQVHNCIPKDLKDSGHGNAANRRTTPV
ncbi:voltage-dependent calcium channel gamma-2 subunit [Clupea harengus]|uniref:Voltage-dependent calcium channel gamma-2 subunit n=1 Tax=Clupea harengus TaxID=7950 RepID=A0A6P8F2D4_CLUHA|nr:voltage-dependent calcium channel gamma-2 subunit [Clupea harengus]